MNRTQLVGRLTRTPELRVTDSNKQITNFTVACNYGKGENQKVNYVNCIAWDKQAKYMCDYMKKGDLLSVEGFNQSRSYEDDEGRRIYVQEVVSEIVTNLQPRSKEKQVSMTDKTMDDEEVIDITDEDVPF